MAKLKLRKAKGTSAKATRAKGTGGKKTNAQAARKSNSGQFRGTANSDTPF